MFINMMILEVNSYSSHPPSRRYFLNVSQIAWIRELDKDDHCRDLNGLYKENGTLICMSDGTEIIVDDDVEDVMRSLCVSERSSAHNFDEGETTVIPKVELTGEEASDKKQSISYGCSTPEAEGLMHRMFDKLFEPQKEEADGNK